MKLMTMTALSAENKYNKRNSGNVRLKKKIFMVYVAALFAAPVFAQSEDNKSRTICTISNESQPRYIEVVYANPQKPVPCKVFYTKSGNTTSQGHANNEHGYCEKIERKIVRNLVKSGYECEHEFQGELRDENLELVLNLFPNTQSSQINRSINTHNKTQVLSNSAVVDVETQTESDPETNSAAKISEATDSSNKPLNELTDKVTANNSQALPNSSQERTQQTVQLEQDKTAEQTSAENKQKLDELAEAFGAHLTRSLNVDNNGQLKRNIQKLLAEQFDSVDGLNIEFTVSVNITADKLNESQLAINQTGTDIILPTERAEFDAVTSTKKPLKKLHYTSPSSAASSSVVAQYTLVSSSIDNEVDAHRLAASLKRVYPGVVTRVSLVDSETADWRLVLGASNEQQTLEDALAQLDTQIQQQFSITSVEQLRAGSTELEFIPNDWQRYAIASCYARGKTTTTELAHCSRFLVDADMFIACLGGATCSPNLFDGSIRPEHVDLLAIIGSNDPAAEARTRLIQRVAGCEHLNDVSETEFATCAARSLLNEDQQIALDCYQRDSSAIGLLKCAGSDEISDYALMYERCTADEYFAAECLMDSFNNEYISNAARCVHFEEPQEVLNCAVAANLDVEHERTLNCLQDTSNSIAKAECVARNYLSDEQTDVLNCSITASKISDFGLCAAESTGAISREEYVTAECLLNGNGTSEQLLSCAGGRFVSNEIQSCLQNGITDTSCFDAETELNKLVNNELDQLIDVGHLENPVALFRNDKYILEGGDLPYVLSSSLARQLFSSFVELGRQIKKETKSIFSRFKKKN